MSSLKYSSHVITICIFVVRSPQGVSVLLYVHHLHKGALGGRAHPGRVRAGVPRASCRWVRALRARGHAHRQLRPRAARLPTTPQRPAGQRCAQVNCTHSPVLFYASLVPGTAFERYISESYLRRFHRLRHSLHKSCSRMLTWYQKQCYCKTIFFHPSFTGIVLIWPVFYTSLVPGGPFKTLHKSCAMIPLHLSFTGTAPHIHTYAGLLTGGAITIYNMCVSRAMIALLIHRYRST